jgi:hypothetical protein
MVFVPKPCPSSGAVSIEHHIPTEGFFKLSYGKLQKNIALMGSVCYDIYVK